MRSADQAARAAVEAALGFGGVVAAAAAAAAAAKAATATVTAAATATATAVEAARAAVEAALGFGGVVAAAVAAVQAAIGAGGTASDSGAIIEHNKCRWPTPHDALLIRWPRPSWSRCDEASAAGEWR